MKIGIYSGSFNPVHNGHIALADYIIAQGLVEEIWLIRSPQNPLKMNVALEGDCHRAEMLNLAVEGHPGLKVSTVEDSLPRPNYTINTLRTLQKQFPFNEFHLIIGADNWEIFDRWREWETILNDFHLIVYPRPGYVFPIVNKEKFSSVQIVDAPQFDISSTEIRQLCASGGSFEEFVAENVAEYIKKNNLYR